MHKLLWTALAGLIFGASVAEAAPYDGPWSVIQVCDSTKEGGRGYTWRYDASVKDGHFLGRYGTTTGEHSTLTLEGDILPNGDAELTGQGISEGSDYNIGFAQKQAHIYFQVKAKFSATDGTGDRLGVRRCKFTFSKHRS
jgi:hypothetical protein